MPVEIIAHRGASADAPENTLAAVRLAWEQGADAVEVDVWLTRDGEIVAIHDETPARFTAGANAIPIANQSLAELKRLDVGSWKSPRFAGESIPTLAEVFATVPNGKRLYAEIKCGAEIVPVLTDFVRSHPAASASLVVIGFALDLLAKLKCRLSTIPMLWVIELTPSADGRAWSPAAAKCIHAAKRAGVEGLDVSSCPGVDARFAAEVHAAGLRLAVWTTDDQLEARRLIVAGVDGITTNLPNRLRTWLVGT